MSPHPLSNLELYRYLSSHGTIPLGGIYFRDTLPHQKQYTRATFVICNTSKSSHSRGRHWVCFLVGVAQPEYYDSLGRRPRQVFERFLGSRYTYCTRRLQDLSLPSCGYFVLFYITQRAKGVSFENIVQDMYAIGDYGIISAVSSHNTEPLARL